MVSLSKQVDYALISLGHLVGNLNQVASARQIARQHALPLPVLMKILKRLHQAGILESTRGVKGGYRISINLDELSLARLIEAVDGAANGIVWNKRLSVLPPVQGMQIRLMQLLDQLRVTDLVKPGRRIDVPLDRVRRPWREQMIGVAI